MKYGIILLFIGADRGNRTPPSTAWKAGDTARVLTRMKFGRLRNLMDEGLLISTWQKLVAGAGI